MTIKEKLETIKGKKIAIWCEEEWMADELFKEFGDNNNKYWEDSTCYDLENLESYDEIHDFFLHADKKFYEKHKFEIIKFKDLCKVELSQQDINAILDEKYGKDNWVIK